mgnify:CR=1 FL=1
MKQDNKRRLVLQSLASSLVWAALPTALKFPVASASAAALSGSAMSEMTELIQKAIPKSGELLPVIGMGSARTFDVRVKSKKMEQLEKVLRLFFKHGGVLLIALRCTVGPKPYWANCWQRRQIKRNCFRRPKFG